MITFLIPCNKMCYFCILGYRGAERRCGKEPMTPEDAGAPDLLARDLDRYFGQLVLTYEARLFAFIARQTGSTQEAEDIVQEAFMQAYFALGRYAQQQKAVTAVRPWLYKIALNIFYGRMRKPGLPVVALDFSEEGPHVTVEEDQAQQPEAIFEKAEELRELGALLSQLPEHYRTVINLFYFAELGYQEIADLLNLPLGTVKSHLHRGIQRLRRMLASSPGTGRGTHVT